MVDDVVDVPSEVVDVDLVDVDVAVSTAMQWTFGEDFWCCGNLDGDDDGDEEEEAACNCNRSALRFLVLKESLLVSMRC